MKFSILKKVNSSFTSTMTEDINLVIYLFYLVDKLKRTHNGCDKQILRASARTPPQIGLTIGFMRS